MRPDDMIENHWKGVRLFGEIQQPQPDRSPDREWKPIPIGDLVERGLTAIGITKERVEKLTRTEGKPGGCGCESRKRWLNEVGNKVQAYARNVLIAAKRFYVGE